MADRTLRVLYMVLQDARQLAFHRIDKLDFFGGQACYARGRLVWLNIGRQAETSRNPLAFSRQNDQLCDTFVRALHMPQHRFIGHGKNPEWFWAGLDRNRRRPGGCTAAHEAHARDRKPPTRMYDRNLLTGLRPVERATRESGVFLLTLREHLGVFVQNFPFSLAQSLVAVLIRKRKEILRGLANFRNGQIAVAIRVECHHIGNRPRLAHISYLLRIGIGGSHDFGRGKHMVAIGIGRHDFPNRLLGALLDVFRIAVAALSC